jgi:C-terminal peptidase prc
MPADTSPENLCPGCFASAASDGPCPVCGFDRAEPRPANALPLGTLLDGQFIVGRVLGSPGGFGITYLGFDRRLETTVAIKEYLPRDLATRSADRATVVAHTAQEDGLFRYGLEQFLTEARTLAKLDHPNIVRVRHFFEANDSAYLVMDYYRGLTLAEYLDRQPGSRIPEDKALALMQPVLDGLRAVHAKGLLHRDIKPGNIYLAQTDTGGVRPILLDFGAARQAMGERSRSLSVVLSEGYAPFEQYHRKGKQGTWTDVYAAAAVLYRMLTGKTPPDAVERQHADELVPASQFGVSKHIADAIGSALQMAPDVRTQNVEALQGQLRLRVESPPPPPPKRSTAGIVLGIAALALLGAAGTGGWLWYQYDLASKAAAGTAIVDTAAKDTALQSATRRREADDAAWAAATLVGWQADLRGYLAGCAANGCGHRAKAEARLSPADQEDGHRLTLAERAEIQHWLGQLGYPGVPVDGVPGSATRSAIRSFQAASGLSHSGYLDFATYRMLAETAPAPAEQAPEVGLADLFPTERAERALVAAASVMGRDGYRPVTFDDAFALRVLQRYFDDLDPNRLYFLARDLDRFQRQAGQLGSAIKSGNANTFFDIYRIYRMRVDRRVQYALAALFQPIDLTVAESYRKDRAEAPWAATEAELDETWRLRIKHDLLTLVGDGTAPEAAVSRLARYFQTLAQQTRATPADEVGAWAISAVAGATDAGGSYIAPTRIRASQEGLRGGMEGIGAVLSADGGTGFHRIASVVDGGPAASAGVASGALILAVAQGSDGAWVSTHGLPLANLVDQIRGPKGSAVRLRLLVEVPHGQPQRRDLTIVRDRIATSPPSSQLLHVRADGGNDALIGVVSLSRLYAEDGNNAARSSASDLRRLIDDLTRRGIKGLVLDLRGNTGGPLSEAFAVTGLFIDRADVVRLKESKGRIETSGVPGEGTAYRGPLVVLTNHQTTSGAEIITAALQDNGRALVIGGKTFGSGSVKSWFDLDRYAESAEPLGTLQLTTAMLFRATGAGLEGNPVLPDVRLPTDSDRLPRHADATAWREVERIGPVAGYHGPLTPPPIVLARYRERLRANPVIQLGQERLRRWEAENGRTTVSVNAAERAAAEEERLAFDARVDALVRRLIDNGLAPDGADFPWLLDRAIAEEAAQILWDCVTADGCAGY